MSRLGVTGTDTGVGKTTIACALLALLREAGVRTAAMKPVETGVGGDDPTSDAERLRVMATVRHPLQRVCPYVFPDPVAPLAAAEHTGIAIDLEELDCAFAELCATADAVIVEGAGGALVPITDTHSVLDLFHRWSLEVIIVAANRLGVLNHSLLTVQAVRAAGLRIRGIVLVDGVNADASCGTNAQLLARLTRLPVFGFPVLDDPTDTRSLATAASRAHLDTLVDDLTQPLTHAT
jgi:dethiobiotin synthetase